MASWGYRVVSAIAAMRLLEVAQRQLLAAGIQLAFLLDKNFNAKTN